MTWVKDENILYCILPTHATAATAIAVIAMNVDPVNVMAPLCML